MKKIYLFCSNGMSTSILASRMQSIADDRSLPVEIKAFPYNQLNEIVTTFKPECILLGPQVKYLYEKTIKDFGQTGVAIGVIDPTDYGMMDGLKVLKHAIKLMKSSNK